MAFDGPTAICKVKEVRPHIVLLDMIMPGMGGIDVLKEIKKIDPTVRVVMLTAVVDHELAKRSLELGAYDYLTKPIDLEYLETVAMVTIVNLLDYPLACQTFWLTSAKLGKCEQEFKY